MEIRPSPEIEAVVRRLWRSFAEGSEGGIVHWPSRDPAIRLILSSDDAWFGAEDNIGELLAARSGRLGIERIEHNRLEAFEVGDIGWAATELTVFFADAEPITFRQTALLIIEDAMWRTIQVHTSVGVPETETFGVELGEGLTALMASLNEANTQDIVGAAGDSGIVTVMFTDIEGSTQLSQDLGEVEWLTTIQGHFDEINREVTTTGGTVVKTLGDGAMAAFPTPRGAADAAIAIQRSDADHGIKVRVGIHTGEAVSIGSDYAGVAVAKAARVASAADGGEILVSSATRELLARFDYSFGEERSAELKGLPGTHRLFPLSS